MLEGSLIIITIYWLTIFVINLRKKGWLHPYSLYNALVSLMFISAGFIDYSRYTFLGDVTKGWHLLFLLSFSLHLIGKPLKKASSNTYLRGTLYLEHSNSQIFVIPIIFSCLYLLPYALQGLLLGGMSVRGDLYSIEKTYLLPYSIFTTLAVAVAMFHPLFIVEYFKKSKKKRFSIIYFIGGFVNPILLALCFMERDIFIFLPLLVIYVIYSMGIELGGGLKLNIILLFFILTSISIGRFYQDGDMSYLLYGTIGYIGQQPFVFIDTIQEHTNFYGLARRLPVFSNLLNLNSDFSFKNAREWHFGTIFADLYMMYGWLSYILGAILIRIAGNYVMVKKTYEGFILSLIYIQVVFQGLFYFNLGNRAGNGYILLMIIFYGILKFRKWRLFQL